ncbi:MAG TPA: hypothetical protein VMJ10_28140 [Kofleriaceae bacterium]|nr:hypothetical protein [Kofleriaceae bacterium]
MQEPTTNGWRAKLVAHRWPAVGIAVAAGAFAGLLLPRGARLPVRAKLADMAFAALAGLALRAVRDAAVHRLGAIAMSWWDEAQARARQSRDGMVS